MREILLFCMMAGFIAALSACKPSPPMSHTEGFAQGTTYHITYDNKPETEQAQIQQEIASEFARIDKAISNYRPDSLIEQINTNQSTDIIETTDEIIFLIRTAAKISQASHGCYDLTIKPLFDLWGFKKDQFHFPTPEELASTLAIVGMDNIQLIDNTHLQKKLPNLRIDLSSIGQGYSVMRIAEILERHSVKNYIVEIGGELKIRGKKNDGSAWRIALEKPISTERKVEKVVSFDSGTPLSLMPSGTYHHFFDENGKRFSHILDARTGKPIEHNTVMANAFLADSTEADAWSTALLCMGSKEGLAVANAQGIAALFIDQVGDEFVEIASDALQKQKDVSLKNP